MTREFEKFRNIIHSIHILTGIDEEICRQATERCIGDYGLQDRIYVAGRLYFFLADQQERRFIVGEFRKRVKEKEQEALLTEFRIDIQQGPGMA